MGAAAPASAGGRLMRLALAHAAQSEALGVEPARLANAWRRIETARAAGAFAPAALQADGGAAPTPTTPAGARLIKTWRGETHEVLTTAEGVEWKGRRYASLSAVARAITDARGQAHHVAGAQLLHDADDLLLSVSQHRPTELALLSEGGGALGLRRVVVPNRPPIHRSGVRARTAFVLECEHHVSCPRDGRADRASGRS